MAQHKRPGFTARNERRAGALTRHDERFNSEWYLRPDRTEKYTKAILERDRLIMLLDKPPGRAWRGPRRKKVRV